MSDRNAKLSVLALLCVIALLVPAAAFAAAPTVKTVPYAYGTGGTVVPHPTWVTGYSAGSPATCTTSRTITLKGTLIDNGTGPYKFSWDFGDGSAATPLATVTNVNAIQAMHAYCGDPVANDIFTARLTVQNGALETASQIYYVQVFDKTVDVEANVAIDEGLWYLHKILNRTTCSTLPCGYWSTSYATTAVTAANTHAFFAAGHTETGSDANPYTDDVQRTMRWLFTRLGSDGFAGAPDTNGNAFGIWAGEPSYRGNTFDSYIQGMFLAALVASNNPDATAPLGGAAVIGRKYRDIAQDMVDEWAYCQYGQPSSASYGGWRYYCHDFPDNSTAQWGGISLISAERQWGLTIPAFVKPNNIGWINYSQDNGSNGCGYGVGAAGYQNTCPVWVIWATTSSAMVQMVLDDLLGDSLQFSRGTTWQRDHWDNPHGWSGGPMRYNYWYGLLSFAKSMELNFADAAAKAANTPGIKMLHSASTPPDLDWYGDPVKGIARALIDRQTVDSTANNGSFSCHEYSGDQCPFDTAWAIQMLNQTVIQTGKPVAVAKANPAFALAGQTITLDGTDSYHQNPSNSIVSHSWLVNKVAGAMGACTPGPNCDSLSGPTVTDTFTCTTPPCDFQAQLTVTDNSSPAQTANTFTTVHITNPPVSPTANAGGPYAFCNQVVPWILDGSKSSSPTQGQVANGCTTCTPNSIKQYAWNIDGSSYSLTSSSALVDATSQLQAAHPTPGNYIVQLKVTDNSSLAFPPSLDLTSSPAQATVVLQGDCACVTNLAATAKSFQVQLAWSNVGADSYNIYRSLDGAVFNLIGSLAGNTTSTTLYYQNTGLTNGTKYYYVVKPVSSTHIPNEWCTSNTVSATPSLRSR